MMCTLNAELALITGLVVPPMTWISTRYGRAMTETMRTPLQPRRRFQCPDRGERRRHPRRAGVRQRGPRAGAVRRRQRPLPAEQTGRLPPDVQKHVAQLHDDADRAALRDDRGRVLRAAPSAVGGRFRRFPSSRERVFGPSRRSTPSWRPIPKGSRASSGTRRCWTPSPTLPTRRTPLRSGTYRGRSGSRVRPSATTIIRRSCATST